MNTNDIIQEAAEAYDGSGMSDETFTGIVDFFLTYAKTQGYELAKVEGDDEAIANHLFKAEVNTFTDSTGFEVQVVGYADFVTAINQALAIGREQGRRDYEEQQRKIFKQLPPKPDL
jgi:hypothetical protein